jgi:hypothetical protein
LLVHAIAGLRVHGGRLLETLLGLVGWDTSPSSRAICRARALSSRLRVALVE